MPQINLLSPGLKKSEKQEAATTQLQPGKKDLSKLSSALILHSAVCGGVLLVVWALLFFNIYQKEKTFKDLEGQVASLAANPKEMENLRNEQAALEKKVKLIDVLSSRKFFWNEKLQLLSNLIPDGVWVTDISSRQEGTITPGNPASGEKTVFIIKGTAVAYKIDEAVTLIGSFIKKLQENQDFSKDFTEIKLNNIIKGSVGGLDVMQFDFLCTTK